MKTSFGHPVTTPGSLQSLTFLPPRIHFILSIKYGEKIVKNNKEVEALHMRTLQVQLSCYSKCSIQVIHLLLTTWAGYYY